MKALLGFFGRAAISAIVVVSASVIAEAVGPVLGALAASLPVSAGPTYVFLALTHDASFISASALSSFAANAATIVFLAAYVQVAVGRTRLAALLPAVLVWLVTALLIHSFRWTALSALCVECSSFRQRSGVDAAHAEGRPDSASSLPGYATRSCRPGGGRCAFRCHRSRGKRRAWSIRHGSIGHLSDRIRRAHLCAAPSHRRCSLRDPCCNRGSSDGGLWAHVPGRVPSGCSARRT